MLGINVPLHTSLHWETQSCDQHGYTYPGSDHVWGYVLLYDVQQSTHIKCTCVKYIVDKSITTVGKLLSDTYTRHSPLDQNWESSVTHTALSPGMSPCERALIIDSCTSI